METLARRAAEELREQDKRQADAALRHLEDAAAYARSSPDGGRFADPAKLRYMAEVLQKLRKGVEALQRQARRRRLRPDAPVSLRSLRGELFDDGTILLIGQHLRHARPPAGAHFRPENDDHVDERVSRRLFRGHDGEPVMAEDTELPVTLGARVRALMRRYRFALGGAGPSHEDPHTGLPVLDVYAPPADGGHALRVVHPANRMRVIRGVYDDPSLGGYRGLASLYRMLSRWYVGVHKKDVRRFLDRRPGKQQRKRKRRRASRAIRPSAPMRHWQMDFIMFRDPKLVSRNNRYEYVCVIVDVFSKYLWALPLRTREQDSTREADRKKDRGEREKRLLRGLRQNGVFRSGSEALSREARRWYAALLRRGGGPRTKAGLLRMHLSYRGGDAAALGRNLDAEAIAQAGGGGGGGGADGGPSLFRQLRSSKKRRARVSLAGLRRLVLADMDPDDTDNPPRAEHWDEGKEPAWAAKALETLVGLDDGGRRSLQRYTAFLDKLEGLFRSVGAPKVIQADNEFRSEGFVELLRRYGVELRHSLAHRPYVQGAVERVNGTLKKCLRPCMERSGGVWVRDDEGGGCLRACVASYNSHQHSTTRKVPFALHFPGRPNPADGDMRERLALPPLPPPQNPPAARQLREARDNLNRAADLRLARHREPPLRPGDLVRVFINTHAPLDRDKNLALQTRAQLVGDRARWSEEVYRVAARTPDDRYLLEERPVNLVGPWAARRALAAGASSTTEAARRLAALRDAALKKDAARNLRPLEERLRTVHGFGDRLAARAAAGFENDVRALVATGESRLMAEARAMRRAQAEDREENHHAVALLAEGQAADEPPAPRPRLFEDADDNFGRAFRKEATGEHHPMSCGGPAPCHGSPQPVLRSTGERRPRRYLRHHLLLVALPSPAEEGFDEQLSDRVDRLVKKEGRSGATGGRLKELADLARRAAAAPEGARTRKDGPARFRGLGDEDHKKFTRLVRGAAALKGLRSAFRMRELDDTRGLVTAELGLLGLPALDTEPLPRLKERLRIARPLRKLSAEELRDALREEEEEEEEEEEAEEEKKPWHELLRRLVFLREHKVLTLTKLRKLLPVGDPSAAAAKRLNKRPLLRYLAREASRRAPLARRNPDTGLYFTRDLLRILRRPANRAAARKSLWPYGVAGWHDGRGEWWTPSRWRAEHPGYPDFVDSL